MNIKPNRISMKSQQNKSVRRRRHAWFCHVSTMEHASVYFFIYAGFILLNYCVNDTVAFNLENRLPIVKYGDADTYFGYSVAGHIVGEKDDAHTDKW